MKHLPTVAGILLGGIYVFAGMMFLLNLAPTPELPPDTPVAHFMAAFGPTGYMAFVKVCEVLGGILVAIPRTRVLGLAVLTPILANIVAFHVFVTGGHGLWEPMLLAVYALTGYLLWSSRAALHGLCARG
jgi:putative oxidoreductase